MNNESLPKTQQEPIPKAIPSAQGSADHMKPNSRIKLLSLACPCVTEYAPRWCDEEWRERYRL